MSEDFNKLRLLAKQMNHTDFRQGWQFRMEITSVNSSLPPDFDIYVKDVTYDPTTIDTEDEKIGGHTFTWPTSVSPTTVSMTMRDNVDQRIRKWFKGLTGIIVRDDGTIELINKIEVQVIKYALNPDGSDGESESWQMFPTKLGEITESREGPGAIEFPITFVQHRTCPNP